MSDQDKPEPSKLSKLFGVADKLKRLPIIGDSLASVAKGRLRATTEELIKNPDLERKAALAGLVPKRCGLCVYFSLKAGQDFLKSNQHFLQAMGVLGPERMGRAPNESVREISAAALELRPSLVESWEDYGRCGKHNRALWGFEEAPRFKVEERVVTETVDGEEIKRLEIVLGDPCEAWE